MGNTKFSQHVILVTGAGSGIGQAVAITLAREGHIVYASMRNINGKNAERQKQIDDIARQESLQLHVIEMDVQSESSCGFAVEQVLTEQGRLDVVVNNAGMLMVGVTEAFTPEQVTHIIDVNAVSWLRVNRAVLPIMRRQQKGLIIYIGSTTSRIHEPFIGAYIASKVAGDALAEIMGMEARPFGIDSVIVVPGAFTDGTEHFSHAQQPSDQAVSEQYNQLNNRIPTLASKLEGIDAKCALNFSTDDIGKAVASLVNMPQGHRPSRVTIDNQQKGTEELDRLHDKKQAAFLTKMGLGDLLPKHNKLIEG